MSTKQLARLLLEPGVLLKSAWLSMVYRPRHFLDLPIMASWSTQVQRARGSELLLGGQLSLGYWPGAGESRRPGPVPLRETVLRLGRGSKMVTDGWVILGSGVHVVVAPEAEVHIGGGTYITANSQMFCQQSIEIGSGCAIAWEVLIMDTDFHWLSVGGEARPYTLPVRIGNHVWIGAGATILKGVTIGDGAVVGAGSVVTKAVPAGTLVAGVPARVVRYNVDWR